MVHKAWQGVELDARLLQTHPNVHVIKKEERQVSGCSHYFRRHF